MVGQSLAEGRYELIRELGQGGMATVYLARDHRLKVDRAIKILDERYAHKTEVRARFQIEAQAMARLEHPNIVKLYDVCLQGTEIFIVMEFIDGMSVLQRIEQGTVSTAEALDILIDVLTALDVAHANGIIHRDIKPHNILLGKDGGVWVSDFGIARCIGDTDMSVTRTGVVMGTWAFMAPEQRSDAKGVDHLADIYSVGATLYALVTGETPRDLFAAEIDPSMFRKVPDGVETVIRRACAYWMADRYPSANVMAADLRLTKAIIDEGGVGPVTAENLRLQRLTTDSGVTPGPPVASPDPPRPASPPPLVSPRIGPGWFTAAALGVATILIAVWLVRDASMLVGSEVGAGEEAALPEETTIARGEWEYGEGAAPERREIVHEVSEQVLMGEPLDLYVDIPGTQAYDQVWIFFRPVDAGLDFIRTRMRRKGDGYRGSIDTDRLMQHGLEYYIEAHPYQQGMPVLTSASARRTHRVEVVRP